MRHSALLLAFTLLLGGGCDRARVTDAPIGVPPNAVFSVAAPTLAELRGAAAFIDALDVPKADDEEQPAWLACDQASVCMLRRGASTERKPSGERWLVPDGDGSVVVWGVDDETTLHAALARWRGGSVPSPTAGEWTGFIEPGPLLKQWQPKTRRAKQLVERVTFQAGRIDFVVHANEPNIIDADLRMKPRAGEPVFVGDLGTPNTDLADVSGLADPEMLGLVRISADPAKLWALLRSTLSAKQRAEADELFEQLQSDAAFDVEDEVLSSLSGHLLLFAYQFTSDPQPQDLLTLQATREALVVGVTDREKLRRAIDAWTQLSGGRLQARGGGDELQWAWLEDGELRWTAMLGERHLLIADSDATLERTRRWRAEPGAPLADVLAERAANAVLEGRNRSGVYVDLAALRRGMPDLFESLPPFESASITAESDGDGEVVRVRLTLPK